MKDFTDAQLAVIRSNDCRSFFVLTIHFALGVKTYSDNKALDNSVTDGVLLAVDALEAKTTSLGVKQTAHAVFDIDDTGKLFSQFLETNGIDNCYFELHRHYHSSSGEFSILVFSGYLDNEYIVNDNAVALRGNNADECLMSKAYPPSAFAADFPYLPENSQGKAIPSVFGVVDRFEALLVQQPPEATLETLMDYGADEFYVDDASGFPAGQILVRVGTEWVRGSFNGNHFSVTERGALEADITFGEKTGNPGLVRIDTISQPVSEVDLRSKGNFLYGLSVTLGAGEDVQVRDVLFSLPDGLVRLLFPFISAEDGYIWPAEGQIGKLISKPSVHYPGEMVTLLGIDYVYAAMNIAADSVALVEGRTGSDYFRIDETQYDIAYEDIATFPDFPFPLLTLKSPWPPYKLNSFVERENLYLRAESQISSGNPLDIIQEILTTYGGANSSKLDLASFDAVSSAYAQAGFSFVITRSSTIETVLNDLCFQSRMRYGWKQGKLFVEILSNQIGAEAALVFNQNDVFAHSSRQKAGSEVVAYISGRYQDGIVYVGDPLAAGKQLSVDLWAYSDPLQARNVLSWWFERLGREWTRLQFDLDDSAQLIDLADTCGLDFDGEEVSAIVEKIDLSNTDKPNTTRNYNVTFLVPNWSGCSTNCETSCEAGGCEVTCESSCTADCEVACQASCMTIVQDYPYYSKACTRTCQLSCRAQDEGAPDCQSGCETGCENNCEGMAFETNCQSGCESYEELYQSTVKLILRASVTVSSEQPQGQVEVETLDVDGQDAGEIIYAYDYLDLNPAVDDEVVVVRLANGSWMVASTSRSARFVKVLSDGGNGSYEVVECDHTGTARGSSFTAYAPPQS